MSDLRRDQSRMSTASMQRGRRRRISRNSSDAESFKHLTTDSSHISRRSSPCDSIQSRLCLCAKCDAGTQDYQNNIMHAGREDTNCCTNATDESNVDSGGAKTPRFAKLELMFEELRKEPPKIEVKEWRNLETLQLYESACQILHLPVVPKYVNQVNNVTVSLSNFQLNPSELKPIVISLVRDSRIISLDLSYNRFGAEGTKYLAEMLQVNSCLISLNLTGTEPQTEGLKALSECLPLNRCLRTLHLSDNKIGLSQTPYIADIIQRAVHLHELHLDQNQLGYEEAKTLGSAIRSNLNLKVLNLQWNHFRRGSAIEICKAVEVNKGLKRLDLGWNGLSKEGCNVLATSLTRNKTLKELNLTSNRIDLQALALLMKGVCGNKGLEVLRLGHNPMTTDGARAILGLLMECDISQIKELDLRGIPIDSRFNDRLQKLIDTREIQVNLDSEIKRKGTKQERKEHDPTNLARFDPIMVLFEYMRMDNMRIMDLFSILDKDNENRFTRRNLAEAMKALKIPLTEHAIDLMMASMDANHDGVVEAEEFINAQRQTIRRVTQRTIRAKALNKEDGGLVQMRQAIRLVLDRKKAEYAEVRTTTKLQPGQPSAMPGSPRKLPPIGGKQITAS